MNRSTTKFIRHITSALLLAASACVSKHAFAQVDQSADDELRSVILLVRHGVRAPIESEIRAGSYKGNPGPRGLWHKVSSHHTERRHSAF